MIPEHPPFVLLSLARDRDDQVKMSIAYNYHAPAAAKERIAYGENWEETRHSTDEYVREILRNILHGDISPIDLN